MRYLLAYDLSNADPDRYVALEDVIAGIDANATNHLNTTWIVNTSLKAANVAATIARSSAWRPADRLCVTVLPTDDLQIAAPTGRKLRRIQRPGFGAPYRG